MYINRTRVRRQCIKMNYINYNFEAYCLCIMIHEQRERSERLSG